MPADANIHMCGAPILQVQDLYKSFQGNRVLRGLSFELHGAGATALIGSNGAGKSTFLNLLSGLLKADRGTIHLGGQDITRLSSHMRSRAGLARTFQHPRTFRSLTVLEAVLLAQTAQHEEGLGRNLLRTFSGAAPYPPAAVARARECLDQCQLMPRADVAAAELTYGERKLLMLAQVLAFGGDLLCFDEICAGLEPGLVQRIQRSVDGLGRSGKTVLFIEHNLQHVRDLADRSVFLHEGAVFREGPTAEVLSDPAVVRLYLGD
jgi:ABC-type branched-subunit amino acid transport system ATPase component